MILYRTVLREGTAETVIEKSRFIGIAKPVTSRREAEDFFASVRSRYKDASHAVPTLIVGAKGELKWTSDDGEPQGTAGPPVLQFLEREGLTNVAVCVVRYFGGRLLGTGGLVRAYTEAAQKAVSAAGRAKAAEQICLPVSFAYSAYPKLQNREKDGMFRFSQVAFTDCVSAQVLFEPEKENAVRSLFTESTAGTVQFGREEKKIVLLPEEL